jgi:hypothetical protein
MTNNIDTAPTPTIIQETTTGSNEQKQNSDCNYTILELYPTETSSWCSRTPSRDDEGNNGIEQSNEESAKDNVVTTGEVCRRRVQGAKSNGERKRHG